MTSTDQLFDPNISIKGQIVYTSSKPLSNFLHPYSSIFIYTQKISHKRKEGNKLLASSRIIAMNCHHLYDFKKLRRNYYSAGTSPFFRSLVFNEREKKFLNRSFLPSLTERLTQNATGAVSFAITTRNVQLSYIIMYSKLCQTFSSFNIPKFLASFNTLLKKAKKEKRTSFKGGEVIYVKVYKSSIKKRFIEQITV